MIKYKYSFLLLLIILVFYLSIKYPREILKPFNYLKDKLFYPVQAINENDELIISSDMKDSIITSLKEDIKELEKLNNITISLSDFDYINATIIERNREYWFNTITINKGKENGIDLDMAVIDNNGLIGRISYVTDNIATVKLITTNDTKNKISAVINDNDNKVYGIINGYDDKNNLLSLIINNETKINKDSNVTTTGMGGVFPSGILIGKVFDTIKKEDGITNIVRVTPIANIEGDKYVSILKRKELSSN